MTTSTQSSVKRNPQTAARFQAMKSSLLLLLRTARPPLLLPLLLPRPSVPLQRCHLMLWTLPLYRTRCSLIAAGLISETVLSECSRILLLLWLMRILPSVQGMVMMMTGRLVQVLILVQVLEEMVTWRKVGTLLSRNRLHHHNHPRRPSPRLRSSVAEAAR